MESINLTCNYNFKTESIMLRLTFLFLLIVPAFLFGQDESDSRDFFKINYDDKTGTTTLEVRHLDREFIYMTSLAEGMGSNDLGLDRGKIGSTRVVKFVKHGNKLLLKQPNLKYRAISDNAAERNAVEEAFASSILWGFEIKSQTGSEYTIDITKFLMQDANRIANYLKKRKEGSYKLDKSRSVINGAEVHSFPKNTEFESILTFVGQPTGKYVGTVTPSADAITIAQHQSFIALPDDGYTPRKYHPYSGFNNILYYDYATAIHEPMAQRYIARHRLIKKNPGAAISEAVEPIIYYVDGGCPEPIKSALIEGASWWNQAYTAAGFQDAFQVKVLPEDAHPLDVRYNVIQWVHRSTRGWSYGASVVDPRTGEIIKGHVSLGSLRVRQDFMIAQGILSMYKGETEDHSLMTEMALARLRQLSAHEVGHTIGLAHNFAASTNDRASVMDYPHPMITMSGSDIDLSDAYDDKIGLWDKRAIIYGYSQSEKSAEDPKLLASILRETKSLGLRYMSDADARPAGGAHPKAHLWDNGSDPVAELNRIMTMRRSALDRFGSQSITTETPYSELEKVFVPVYLMHRYQAEAASKLIGGVDYSYAVKGFDEPLNRVVDVAEQRSAVDALLTTLEVDALDIPDSAMGVLLPSAKGYGRSRESFGSGMNLIFDPLHAAEAYSNFVMGLMLHPDRLSRMSIQSDYSLDDYLNHISESLFAPKRNSIGDNTLVSLIPQKAYVIHLIKIATDPKVSKQVSAMAILHLQEYQSMYLQQSFKNSQRRAHGLYLNTLIEKMNTPETFTLPKLADMPPGSPIGCGE